MVANSGKSLKHAIYPKVFMFSEPHCVPRFIVQSSPLQIVIALRQTLTGETRGIETGREHGRYDVREKEGAMTTWPSTLFAHPRNNELRSC